jgi:transketolase C-terminal domain/subunit
VVVDDAQQCLASHYLEALGEQENQRLLVVACESRAGDAAGSSRKLTDSLSEAATRLGWSYIGPLSTELPADLLRQVAEIKAAGQPAVLHLRTSGNAARPAAAEVLAETVGDALCAVASLAANDPRVVAVCTAAQAWQSAAWDRMSERLLSAETGLASALAWCVESAASGSRPFVVLSADELLEHLGAIRQTICQHGSAVTLLVESGRQSGAETAAPVAPHSLLSSFAELSLLSPMDTEELSRMLTWCAASPGPKVIWLPGPLAPPRATEPSEAITAGAAARLVSGSDLAIIAWGPLARAAALAAEQLAQQGLTATVLNLRFAQPLDVGAVVEAARHASCVVLLDDAPRGGISSCVLEELARAGIAQPVSLITTRQRSEAASAAAADQEASSAIVEQCRWLSEPVAPNATESSDWTNAPAPYPSPGGGWLAFFGQQPGQRAREQVYATQLSSDVERWVAQYREIGSRDLYLWKWCRLGAEITTLPGVVPELRAHVCDTKVLSIVLCVLLDDVADQHGNGQLLDALLEMTCWGSCQSWPRLSAAERRHAETARALWIEYQARFAGYPVRAPFEPVLRFDLQQFFNTMRYSHLVNGRPYLLNTTEHDLYTSHNMMMISFGTLDLMCSPGFPLGEVSALREMLWHAQNMGRIGNLLSTWQRELAERDFTSGVFARALRTGDLTLAQLQASPPAEIEATIRARGHLAHFHQKWQEHRQKCHARAEAVRSLDLRAVLEGHDRFFAMHLGSQGLI